MAKGKALISSLLAFLILSAATASASAASLAPSEQIQILAETVNSGPQGGWFVMPEQDADWARWCYAVTDLNHNGRLEIFKAKRGGDGVWPELRCEELKENGKGWRGGYILEGDSDMPDIMNSEAAGSPTMLYEPAGNKYHYIFLCWAGDAASSEFANKKYAITLNGDLFIEELATMTAKMENQYSEGEDHFYLPAWKNPDGNGAPEEISAERYANIANERFPDTEVDGVAVDWRSAEEIRELIGLARLPLVLENSCKVFLGDGEYY